MHALRLIAGHQILKYYEEIYNELNELFLVIQWRKQNGLLAKGKRGEKVENDYVTFSFAR